MSFLLNSYVRVTNPNLQSYAKVGVVCGTSYRKTSVKFANGSVIEFLNHNLKAHKPAKAETVQPASSDFREGDIVVNRSGQQAKVTKVHSMASGQYLNVELLGEKRPMVQTWRVEGIKLLSRATSSSYKESFAPPQKPSVKDETGTFILWSPQSNKPPKVVHTTRGQAYEAQKAMSERYPNQEFFIMKAVSKMRMERKVELRPVVTEY